MLRTATLALLLLFAVPEGASAQLAPDPVPRFAPRMTLEIAEAAAWAKGLKERTIESRWPDGARVTVRDCKVTSRRRGRCFYDIDRVGIKACERKVIATIARRTQRVRTRVERLGCSRRDGG